jgi:isopenicillin-N epimerase
MIGLARREFLAATGAALAAGTVGACTQETANGESQAPEADAPEASGQISRQASGDGWEAVRNQFVLSDGLIHMSAMLIASHPRPVREAIEEHRQALDSDPVTTVESNNEPLKQAARAAAGEYLGLDGSAIALTDSTTMGVGLVYNGLRLREGQEILSTEHDYYVTHESIRLASERTGATVRKIALFDDIASVSADGIVERIAGAIRPETRVLAVTWVHSSTGLKLPLAAIAEALAEANAEREEGDQVLFCVDAVHGFGVEDATLPDLGCDFMMAGCHKWLFGPRGTGIIAGTERGWRSVVPSIPSFIADRVFDAWITGGEPPGPTNAAAMTPGGFKPFEHQWAMTQAFEFQQGIGKARVAERTHALAGQLKEGLAEMPHVILHTPRSADLSAGIVAFDVDGMSPSAVVGSLRQRGIIASVSPYANPHVRLTPSIRNSPDEIETVLVEIRALGD